MFSETHESPLPAGYAGDLMVEIADERYEEDAAAALIMERARSLAWQAVRHTPGRGQCAAVCLAWLRQARLWAARRDLEAMSAELSAMLERLEQCLPLLH